MPLVQSIHSLVNDAPGSVPAERNEGEDTSTKEKTASVEALPEVE